MSFTRELYKLGLKSPRLFSAMVWRKYTQRHIADSRPDPERQRFRSDEALLNDGSG